MKVLVTGATGFLGKHFMRKLEQEGYCTTGIYRRDHGIKSENYIKCDLSQDMPNVKTDVIIHAATLNPAEKNTVEEYVKHNIIATQNIIVYARKYSVKKIIYMGTVSSFGNVNGILKEDSPHNNPECYGVTKWIAEQMICESGIPYNILILPGVVGRGCRDNWIIKMARNIYLNKDCYFFNGNEMFNNIVEVEDICNFVVRLLGKDLRKSGIYLLGSEDMMKVETVLFYLRDALRSNSKLYEVDRTGNPCFLNVQKALHAGYSPKPIKTLLDIVCEEVEREEVAKENFSGESFGGKAYGKGSL